MVEALTWLLVIEAFGLAALPLALWLFRALPDRGVAFAKPLGLLFVGYLVWFGTAMGALAHVRATIAVVLLGLAVAAWYGEGRQTLAWLRERVATFVVAEAVFLAAFLFAATLRAYNPEILGTEKPMDFAFLNAALRGERVPPEDPWLAGFGISYYYFGYFLFAMVAKLAATTPAVAFNLALATLFGLTAAGAYGLVANLVAGRAGAWGASAVRYGLLGAAFTVLLANLEGFLEVLNVNGLLPVGIWQWLGIKDLTAPRVGPTWYPTDPPDTWWWWRATRVVGDFDLATGATRDYTINEFPFFSFLLGDLHPHVMSLPFLLLALALALAILREPGEVSGAWLARNRLRALAYGVAFGALGFLNSWDLPTALGILVLAVTAQRARTGSLSRAALIRKALGLGIVALLVALVLYLPFYFGFRSQASGVGLVGARTKIQQLVVVWGPLLFTAGAYPLYLALAGARRRLTRAFAGAGAGVALVAVVGLVFLDEVALRRVLGDVANLPALLLGTVTFVVLLALLAPSVAVYWGLLGAEGRREDAKSPEDIFALVLVGVAVALLLVCEVVFVRDGFGNRMNTVFKLYYQGWVLLAAAAAYGLYYLGQRRRQAGWSGMARVAYGLWRGVAVLLLVLGLVYTVFAPISKTDAFAGPPTLDGLAWLRATNPKEYEAIAWLAQRPGTPVILEASGAEYSDFNRASAFTGLPSVLGWAGHEYQWRGTTPEPAARKTDVDTIYQTVDVNTAARLLEKYDVRYVVVGDQERQAYARAPLGVLAKFARLGAVAFRNERVTIYEVK